MNLSPVNDPIFESLFVPAVKRLVDQALIEDPCQPDPYSEEAKRIKNFHRNVVLENGRADFALASQGLTPEQKVDLYCYYYFQMHCVSSWWFYRYLNPRLNTYIKTKDVFFVDIGCGPFTSGLAFNYYLLEADSLNKLNVDYIGIDTADSMLTRAKDFDVCNLKLRYKNISFHNTLLDLSNSFPKDLDITIIINYSYIFASHSLDPKDFIDFTNNLYSAYPNSKILIFQQNPTAPSLNNKWRVYKQGLKNINSLSLFPTVYGFQYEDVVKSSNRPRLSFNCSADLLMAP
ncbi:class I SAM-dependent methyltransferase [Chitinophaga ginsengisoli]|uniref:Methyltransferase family protein n=1 Tax=Chitinophaga ginsengisoli TaxID=363837 RepID=A0A2P8FPX9_9BACT|nr:class I SAM-dependent methyltransferase [Chitinophaga ginsengisoli]PSL23715.1 hypothetical protein CLV42_11771 [Chitinophaga ginsengisoli]